MHIQIINFQLDGIEEPQYRALCEEVAPAFAAVPGLISKVWLANAETNTYGGVYTWADRGSMDEFSRSELFETVANHPNLSNVSSRDFAVLDAPTAVTNGLPGREPAAIAS